MDFDKLRFRESKSAVVRFSLHLTEYGFCGRYSPTTTVRCRNRRTWYGNFTLTTSVRDIALSFLRDTILTSRLVGNSRIGARDATRDPTCTCLSRIGKVFPIVLTASHTQLPRTEGTLHARLTSAAIFLKFKRKARENPSLTYRQRRKVEKLQQMSRLLSRGKSHFTLNLQKPCSEDSVNVTKTNCAAGTDGNRDAEDPPLWGVVVESRDGVNGVLVLRGLGAGYTPICMSL